MEGGKGHVLLTLTVHSRHGIDCPMPMVEAARLWIPLAGLPLLGRGLGWEEQAAAGEVEGSLGQPEGVESVDQMESGKGKRGMMPKVTASVVIGRQGEEGGLSGAEAEVWGQASGSSGGREPGIFFDADLVDSVEVRAPFRFTIRDLDASLAAIRGAWGAKGSHDGGGGGVPARGCRCLVELTLKAPWADEDKRTVILEHPLEPGSSSADSMKKEEGELPAKSTIESSHQTFHRFVTQVSLMDQHADLDVHHLCSHSQVQRYDLDAVIAAYRANPPEVRRPESKVDKKQRKELQASATSGDGPSTGRGSKAPAKEHHVGARRSQRFASASGGG